MSRRRRGKIGVERESTFDPFDRRSFCVNRVRLRKGNSVRRFSRISSSVVDIFLVPSNMSSSGERKDVR